MTIRHGGGGSGAGRRVLNTFLVFNKIKSTKTFMIIR